MDGDAQTYDGFNFRKVRRRRRRIGMVALAILLGIAALVGLTLAMLNPASAIVLLNALAPRRGVSVTTDIAYGSGPRHKLDVFAPRGAAGAPVAVFFYGGGWEEGDRANYRFVGAALAASGVVTVIPDYRVYPEVRFPGFVDDGASAVRWARDHAKSYGGDPAKIFLIGHSAGAHIAAMLAFDRRYLRAVGMDPHSDIAGFVGLAGPYDFLPLHSDTLRTIFGPPDRLALSQPINFVDAKSPPTLVITGDSDTTVDPGNATRLAARIREVGGSVETLSYHNISHALLVGTLATQLRFLAPTFKDVRGFIARHDGETPKATP